MHDCPKKKETTVQEGKIFNKDIFIDVFEY